MLASFPVNLSLFMEIPKCEESVLPGGGCARE